MREIATRIAWKYYGTFYSWGGDDPSGFDCSGLVIEILKSVGLLPRKYDTSSAGLLERFKPKTVEAPAEGCLVFRRYKGRIVHVEYCLTPELSMGASGGGSATLTRADAIRHNAFVKVRSIASDRREAVFVDPFMTPTNPKEFA